MGVAAALVAEEVRRAAEDPLAGWDWMTNLGQVDMDRLVNLAGSTRFPAYEAADFGWDPPGRTELVTMNHDGQVVLVAGKGSAGGGVQASVSLHRRTWTRTSRTFSATLGDFAFVQITDSCQFW